MGGFFFLEKERLPRISMGALKGQGILAAERGYIEESHEDNLFNAKVLFTFTCLYTYAYITSCLLIKSLIDSYLVTQTSSLVSLRS